MKFVDVWCRMDNAGVVMNVDEVVVHAEDTRVQIGQEAWDELQSKAALDEVIVSDWDDPTQMDQIEGEWPTEHLWVKKQLEDWNMDPSFTWEFFCVPVPLKWAEKNRLLFEEQELDIYDHRKRNAEVRRTMRTRTKQEQESVLAAVQQAMAADPKLPIARVRTAVKEAYARDKEHVDVSAIVRSLRQEQYEKDSGGFRKPE